MAAIAGFQALVAPALLERMVAPVIDNANRHAHSQVEVVARARAGRVIVEHVFSAGFRARDEHDGARLGLALARRAAATIGATVQVPSAGFRTVFTIELPSA